MSPPTEHGWSHPLCDDCWFNENVEVDTPATRIQEPHRLEQSVAHWEVCCKCANFTHGGIYVRRDPAQMPYCPHKGPSLADLRVVEDA